MNKGAMLDSAIQIAAVAHAGQFDRGGMPYILHPLKVMHYLKTDDIELMCIAVLHDVLEDSKYHVSGLIAHGMSKRVVRGVVALTRIKGQSDEDYLEDIRHNYDAIRVKLADLRHNSDIRRLKGLRDKDFERMIKYHNMYIILKEDEKEYHGKRTHY